jgi:Domain of unknown function (DUF4920)
VKKILSLMILVLVFAVAAFAQDDKNKTETNKTEKMSEKMKPTEKDKTEAIPADGVLKRGAAIGNGKKVSLAKVLANPQKYAGKTVRVEGVIVRSCKMEGCWMELAPKADAKSVRVQMKDHAFFIPLNSAGAKAKAEGVFTVKVLSKEQVKHMIEEDGAKFDNINEDGSVTEISFLATGVELTRAGK